MKELYILSKEIAATFQPEKPTRAIRLIDFPEKRRALFPPLQGTYTHIHTYYFDDIDYDTTLSEEEICAKGLVRFNHDIAEQLLQDFQSESPFEAVLIHCSAGLGRSPGVAIALNEIFNLGYETWKLESRYAHYNKYIRQTLRDTAQSLGLIE